MMRVFFWSLGASLLVLAGCGALRNDYDRLMVLCGDDVTQEWTRSRVIRFKGSGGSPLGPDDLEVVHVNPRKAQDRRHLEPTTKGCVALPKPAKGRLLARHQGGDQAALVDLNERSGALRLQTPVRLKKRPSGFTKHRLEPACPADKHVRKNVPLRYRARERGRWDLFRTRATIETLDGTKVKGNASAKGFQLVAMPQENLVPLSRDLPDGRYRLTVQLNSVFSPAATDKDAKPIHCEVTLDRSRPKVRVEAPARKVSLTGEKFTRRKADRSGDGERKPDPKASVHRVRPGASLPMNVSDGTATELFVCLERQNERGRWARKCSQRFKPWGGDFYVPNAGAWTLFYYAEDAAGNRSETKSYPFIVYHGSVIRSIRARLKDVENSLLRHRAFESMSTIFEIIADYEELALSYEKEQVRDELLGTLMHLGRRTGEVRRYEHRSSSVEKLTVGAEGRIFALYDDIQTAEMLAPDGTVTRIGRGVSDFHLLEGKARLVLHVRDAVEIYDPRTGRRTSVTDGVLGVRVSGDGSLIFVQTEDSVHVYDAKGRHQESSPPIPEGSKLHTVNREGTSVALTGKRQIVYWDRRTGSGLTTFTPSSARCDEVTATAVSPDGKRVYFGTNDRDVHDNYINVKNADTPCGFRVWHPKDGSVDRLAYPYGNASYTPNHVTEIRFEPKGQWVFALNYGGDLLSYWEVGGERSGFKTVDANGSAGSLAVGDGQLVVTNMAQEMGVLRLTEDFPQRSDSFFDRWYRRLGDEVQAAAFDGEGRLVTGDSLGRVRVWNPQQGSLPSWNTDGSRLDPRVALDGKGREVVVFQDSGTTLRLQRVGSDLVQDSGRSLNHDDPVVDFALLDSPLRLVSLTKGGLRLWALDGELLATAADVTGGKLVARGGQVLVLDDRNAGWSVWKAADGRLERRAAGEGAATDGAIGPQGEMMALKMSGSWPPSARVVRLADGRVLADGVTLPDPQGVRTSFSPFSPDGERMVFANGAEALVLNRGGEPVARVPLGERLPDGSVGTPVAAYFADPQGESFWVAYAQSAEASLVRLAADGNVEHRVKGLQGSLARLRLLPGGGTLAAMGREDSAVTLYDRATGARRFRLGDRATPVAGYSGSRDGSVFVTGMVKERERRIDLWPVGSVEKHLSRLCRVWAAPVGQTRDPWGKRARRLCGVSTE